MDNEKMGQFILELRKSHQMTQKDLAIKLNVSDKAVSKWERGLSCPDISLLSPLSDIFGITIGELLEGKRNDSEIVNAEESIDNAVQYAIKAINVNTASLQKVSAIVYTCLLLIGILTCVIIDLAISGTLTWSFIPVSACILAWLIFVPTMRYGMKGILVSLIVFSVLVVPFFLILNNLVNTGGLLLPIGIRTSIVAIVYLWIVFGLFKLLKSKTFIAAAVSLLLTIPFSLAINFILSRIIQAALLDVWDAMAFAIIIVLACVLFIVDYTMRKRTTS
ncbi:MAG: helix-turn-helix domain-containing protein [Oscillospiraceae bacterium]|nr:helix-turn-helix domain-containing protein [Oscillospiraceae bacterium]